MFRMARRTFEMMIWSFAALTTACASTAQAPDHETWRCDAPSGQFDDNELPIPEKATSISGRLLFHKPNVGSRWASTAKIGFTDSRIEDGDCHCNGIIAEAFPAESIVRYYMLVDGESTMMRVADYETAITFKLSMAPDGRMTAQVGKHNPTIKTAMTPHPARNTLLMSCSGADASFLNIDAQ